MLELKAPNRDRLIEPHGPDTQSPITLLELGLVIGSETDFIICCPDGYFRKGNIEVTVAEFSKSNVVLNNLDELIATPETYVDTFNAHN